MGICVSAVDAADTGFAVAAFAVPLAAVRVRLVFIGVHRWPPITIATIKVSMVLLR
jgi:hypothetical protein